MAMKEFPIRPFLGFTKQGKDTFESMIWRTVNYREWYEYVNNKKTDHRLGTTVTLINKDWETVDVKTPQMFDIEKADELIGQEATFTISETKIYVQSQGNFSKLATTIIGQLTFLAEKKQPQGQGQK